MKKSLTLLTAFLIAFISFAQNGINYKALIKDNNGNVISNQSIDIQFSILQASTVVYEETHNLTTNQNGLAITNIGEGTVISGDFNAIEWASDDHFLNVQVNTGSGLVDLGTTEFKTVPYALASSDNYWTKNGTDIYTSNSEVGINSSDPEHTLDVRSSSQTEASQLNMSNNDKSRFLRFFSGSETFPDPSMTWAPGHSFLFASFDDNTLVFNEYMRISSLGDVGIGINNPEARLDILGGDWNLDAGNPGDLRIGNSINNFRIGVATGGGGAGITRMYTNSNALILGVNDTPSLLLEPNGEIKAPSITNALIESAGSKSLITKEYADATYSSSPAVTKEIMIPATSFATGTDNYYYANGIAFKNGFNSLFASIILPVGATITEISAYIFDNTTVNFVFDVITKNLDANELNLLLTMESDNSSDYQVLTSTTPFQITSNHTYYMYIIPAETWSWPGFGNGIQGVKIKYTE